MILRGCCSSISIFGFFMLAPLGPFWSALRKKGRKDRSDGANMPLKLGQIEVLRHSDGMHSVFERNADRSYEKD
jgi:hypothetical protein